MITDFKGTILSVIIPVDGREHELLRLLTSLSTSRNKLTEYYFSKVEVIIVDSTTQQQFNRYLVPIDPTWMHHVTGPKNVRQKRNLGAQSASGIWVAFIDSDCWVSEDYFFQLFQVLLDKPEIEAWSGRIIYQGIENLNWRIFSKSHMVTVHTNMFDNFEPKLWGGAANLIIRRDVFLKHGGFDNSLPGIIGGEDIELCLRLNRVGVALCALNDVVAYHPTEPWSTIRAITSKTWRWGRFEYHLSMRHSRFQPIVSPPFIVLFIILAIIHTTIAIVDHKPIYLIMPLVWGLISHFLFTILYSPKQEFKEYFFGYITGFLELLFQTAFVIESIKHHAFRNLICPPVFELDLDSRYKSEVTNSYSNLISLLIIIFIDFFL